MGSTHTSRFLRSGELAALTGVSTDTLRHYERVGVLPRAGRTRSGYRQYPLEAADRVRIVRRALAMGFRLAELARIFGIRDRGGAPCRQVYSLAARKLAEVEERITELIALRAQLQSLVEQWGTALDRTPPGQRAGLLEALLEPPSGKAHPNGT